MTTSQDRTTTSTADSDTRAAPEAGLQATPAEPNMDAPVAEQDPASAEAPSDATSGPLVPEHDAMDFRSRWEATQQGFVDEPRTAVTDADRLVGEVLERLSTTFEEQHHELERQWADGEPSTEDLRTALQRYRTFFERLLTI